MRNSLRITPFYLLLFLGMLGVARADWTDYNRAVQFYRQAQFDSAIVFAKKVPPADSLYFYARLLMGHAQLELDSLKQAKKSFEKLLSFRQKQELVYNGLGLYYFSKFKRSRGAARLLKKLFATDDLQKARKYFRRATKLNPDYPDAWINYYRTFMAAGNADETERALNGFRGLLKKYPDNVEILYHIGRCQELLNREMEAYKTFREVLKEQPEYSPANLSLAFLFFRQKNDTLFSRYYYRGCRGLRDPDWLRRLYLDIADILSDRERPYFRPGRVSGKQFLEFWEQRDPIPITDENERLIEHYKRLAYVRSHYQAATPTGYDDRGKIYLRYGPPDDYYRSASADGFMLDNESWVYRINGETYHFDFVQKGAGFVLVRDLSAAVSNPNYSSMLYELQKAYNARAHLSNYYMQVNMALQNLRPRGATGVINQIRSELSRYNAREQARLNRIPISTYNLQLRGEDLTFDYDTFPYFHIFKKRWYLDVFYGVPLEQLSFRMENGELRSALKQDLVVYKGSRLGEKTKLSRRLLLASRGKQATGYYLGKVSVPLFSGKNLVYFELQTAAANKFRIVNSTVAVPAPKTTELQMSGILLSNRVRPQKPADDSLFCRNGFYLQPLPSRNFDKNRPLYCYFELYNIRLSQNSGRCRVEYRILARQNQKNVSSLLQVINPFSGSSASKTMVSIVNELEFSGKNAPVVLAFDVSQLQSGIYELQVKVTDVNSEQEISQKKLLRLY